MTAGEGWRKIHVLIVVVLSFSLSCNDKKTVTSPAAIKELLDHKEVYWLNSGIKLERAKEWLMAIRNSDTLALSTKLYKADELLEGIELISNMDSIQAMKTDEEITRTILKFIRHLQEGDVNFSYDIISPSGDSLYAKKFLEIERDELPVSEVINSYDCKDKEYLLLKRFLNDSLKDTSDFRRKLLVTSINYKRFICHHQTPEYIVINIPHAEAMYFKNDSLKLKMKVIVGKTANPTPLCASYITAIETYPYWLVPKSIAEKEIIPKIIQEPDYLTKNNFEVVTRTGKPLNADSVDWKQYSQKHFPYYFRQATGCENALGLLKFNLETPFSVYLHATNQPSLFKKQKRFLSHGCVRLEKPFMLANELLRGHIDTLKLQECKINIKPERLKTSDRVAVFIVYMPVVINNERIVFKEDIYKLVQ